MIEAFIFDLDGVIADSEPLSFEASDIALAKYGIKKTEKERKEAFGRRAEDIYSDILKSRKMDMDVNVLIKEKDDVFTDIIKGKLKPIPNSLELIGFLRENKFRLALATSSHRDKMLPEVRELGIEDHFEHKITGDDVSRGKPHPDIFLKAAEKLGVSPEKCAVVEDSEFGIQAAKRAGMFCFAFDSPNSPDQDMSAADMIVSDLSEIEEYIKKNK